MLHAANRYYGIFGKHLSMYMLQKHLAKILRRSKKRLSALEAEGFEERAPFIRPRDAQSEAAAVATTNKRKKKPKKRRPRRGRLERLRSVVRWETVGSQALQQITERIRNGYRLFFDNVRARKAKLTKRRVSPPTLATMNRVALSERRRSLFATLTFAGRLLIKSKRKYRVPAPEGAGASRSRASATPARASAGTCPAGTSCASTASISAFTRAGK